MKTRSEIKVRIDEVIKEMEKIRKNAHTDNVLIYSDEAKSQWKYLDEIWVLYWVLQEPFPDEIFNLVNMRS